MEAEKFYHLLPVSWGLRNVLVYISVQGLEKTDVSAQTGKYERRESFLPPLFGMRCNFYYAIYNPSKSYPENRIFNFGIICI